MYYSLLALFLIIGLVMGSFIHCLVSRCHRSETLGGRSFCFGCNEPIAWYDNIPLLSWLLLKGRCRHCHCRIAIDHFILELASGLLYAFSFAYLWQKGEGWLSLTIYLAAISLWLFVFLSDYFWLEIYLPPLLVGAALILIGQLFLGVSIWSLLFSVALGAAFFGAQYMATRGKGMGSGDIYLGGLMGLIFPDWRLLLTALFLSYILGTILSLDLVLRTRKSLKTKVPLGVFLALGSLLALFIGQQLLTWYLGLLL